MDVRPAEGGSVEFRMLGPLAVQADGVPMPVRGRHHPKLLAILLDEANRVVPVDRLIAGLWDGTPPESARQQIQNVVAGLRRQLGPGGERLRTVGTGYTLDVEPHELDLLRCKENEAEAKRLHAAGKLERAADELRSALQEWRGPTLAGLEGRIVETTARRLDEYRLILLEQRIDLDLERGADDPLVSELRQLTAEHTLRQRFTEQLMLALHRTGRTPEALQLYVDFSERLGEALGIDPGRSLRDLHTAILRDDAAPAGRSATPAASPASTNAPPVRPALLPSDIGAFTGRTEHLRRLDALLDNEVDGVKLVVLTGTGGVGKTALAVRWAHQVAGRFPDGQLFVNLRGFDPHDAALGPDAAVRVLLDALGMPHQRIPADPEARYGLYRSLLADRRLLVVLDNAVDAAQVRPLIPGGRGNLTLVTSRNPLYGLVASQGAQAQPVHELTFEEAHGMLEQRLGKARVAAAPEAVERIIERCARLPLALAIAAARGAAHPDFALAALARELDSGGGLDAFSGDDPATDVRAVFDCSYRALRPGASRLFRLLGLHPGPDLAVPAAASLAALPPQETEKALRELTGAHLLTEHQPGRYAFHDLLRAYAAELVAEVEDDTARATATRRMLDHYLHTACSASRLISPDRMPIEVEPAHPGAAPEPLADTEHGLAWLTDERQVLTAAVSLAADAGFDTIAWQLAWAYIGFAFRQGKFHDGIAAQSSALDAARNQGDARRQVYSHRMLAVHLAELDDFEGATRHLEQALELCDKLQDRMSLAQVYFNLARIHERSRTFEEAVRYGHRSLELYQELGDEWREGTALNAVGWYSAQLGRYDEALDYCERGLALQSKSGNKVYLSSTWDSIGFIHHRQGRFDLAVECLRRSLELSRETGHRTDEAEVLVHLGDAYQGAGDDAAAHAAWREAIRLFHDLDPSRIAGLREKLDRLDRERGEAQR